jgi:hypothetical protein
VVDDDVQEVEAIACSRPSPAPWPRGYL